MYPLRVKYFTFETYDDDILLRYFFVCTKCCFTNVLGRLQRVNRREETPMALIETSINI